MVLYGAAGFCVSLLLFPVHHMCSISKERMGCVWLEYGLIDCIVSFVWLTVEWFQLFFDSIFVYNRVGICRVLLLDD